MITKEHFEQRVGRPPEEDDLDRSNCKDAGQVGHYCCGWNEVTDLPNFMSLHVFSCLLNKDDNNEKTSSH